MKGLERSIQVEETAYARLRSREKLDSVPQGLKRASSKEKNGENQETSEEQRALGFLDVGMREGVSRGGLGPRGTHGALQAGRLWILQPPPFCMNSVKLLNYCEPQGPF